MNALLFLLRRYLFPYKGNLLTMALWLSVAGVALGVLQLMLVLSVMSGFLQLFERNYTRISSEMVVIPKQKKEGKKFENDLKEISGVLSVTPFGLGQGMVVHEGVGGVTLEGIDYQTSKSVTPWEDVWVEPPLWDIQKKNPYWIWLGVQLAKKLGVSPGDSVDVMIPGGKGRKLAPFVVTALTKFGIYDHDLRYARVDLAVLKELFRTHHVEPMYKIRRSEEVPLDDLAIRITRRFENIETRKWSDIHENIFLAVQHQKRLLFSVLEIIVALAAVNVINLLLMSAYHRRRDVAILRAIGFSFWKLVSFFVIQGALVGLAGMGFGVALGYGVCYLAEKFQPALLSEKIYNVSYLPFRIQLTDVFLVCAVGFCLCVIFSLIPAVGAASRPPVRVLRDE